MPYIDCKYAHTHSSRYFHTHIDHHSSNVSMSSIFIFMCVEFHRVGYPENLRTMQKMFNNVWSWAQNRGAWRGRSVFNLREALCSYEPSFHVSRQSWNDLMDLLFQLFSCTSTLEKDALTFTVNKITIYTTVMISMFSRYIIYHICLHFWLLQIYNS